MSEQEIRKMYIAQSKKFMAQIERERAKSDMSLGEFAQWLGFPVSTYTNWVYGYSTPKIPAITAMIEKIGGSADRMLGIKAAKAFVFDTGKPKSCPDCAKKDTIIRELMALAISRNPKEERRIRELAQSVVGV